MLFNTPIFFGFITLFYLFFAGVFAKNTPRLLLIVVASLIFYAAWDYRFVGLLIFSGVVDYTVAYLIDQTDDQKRRKRLLLISP